MRYEIILTEPFKCKLKKLKKKYPHIKNDLNRVLSDMENGESLEKEKEVLMRRFFKGLVGAVLGGPGLSSSSFLECSVRDTDTVDALHKANKVDETTRQNQ